MEKGDDMAESIKVRIFGQEYNIVGDKDPELIRKIAEYVDNKAHLISKLTGQTGGAIHALTSLNIAEEYFDELDKVERIRQDSEQALRDNARYVGMLEELKKTQLQTKDAFEELKKERLEESENFKELEKKCSEYENTIFDLQMENIQLKSELDKLRKL
ncbi:MAG: cell division protein ZapA [Eubacterium sp.]|nr:cell division protein ZapA [Eubacterium sp.]